MTPVFAIVGRANVGKSTLFNALTRSRNALVLDAPGITRDRQYGQGEYDSHKFIVIDTGGLSEEKSQVLSLMEAQSDKAIQESDGIFFMVDATTGPTSLDVRIAKRLRQINKPVFLLVNKVDGQDPALVVADFYRLGFSDPIPISASHRMGIDEVLSAAFEKLFPELIEEKEESEETEGFEDFEETEGFRDSEKTKAKGHADIKIAIVGRPNVGKSTLVNRMLGEERVIVLDEPGTTRDSIYVPLEREGERYTLIDTAGVRRRGRIHESLEKFSVVKTLQSIEACDVVIMVMDAREGITEQDLGILGFILDTGKALVIACNKWDNLPQDQRDFIKRQTTYRLNFVDFARIHWISALHGTGVGNLFDSVHEAYHSATKSVGTGELNRILESAVIAHLPPLISGRRIKLRYAHMGGHQPPIIVIHGNQTESVPKTYRRYLSNTFRKSLKMWGTPVRIEFKAGKNPFVSASKKKPTTKKIQSKRKVQSKKTSKKPDKKDFKRKSMQRKKSK